MKNQLNNDLGLPHIEILNRARELHASGRMERLREAAIRVTAAKIKAAKAAVENHRKTK